MFSVLAAVVTIVTGNLTTAVHFPVGRTARAVNVTVAPSVPSSLIVLGRDELLAFHDATVVAYIAIIPTRTVRLTAEPEITFTLPADRAARVPYYLSYRGPGADSWSNPATPAIAVRHGSTAHITFTMSGLPRRLDSGRTYNVVLYYAARSYAGGPNQVVSASVSPNVAPSPTQAT